MNRFMLTVAVLWLALRQRWHESVWNPWGMGSHTAQHRAAQAVMEQLDKQGPPFMRAAAGTDPSAPKPPVQ
jgi:hypothetical protein